MQLIVERSIYIDERKLAKRIAQSCEGDVPTEEEIREAIDEEILNLNDFEQVLIGEDECEEIFDAITKILW